MSNAILSRFGLTAEEISELAEPYYTGKSGYREPVEAVDVPEPDYQPPSNGGIVAYNNHRCLTFDTLQLARARGYRSGMVAKAIKSKKWYMGMKWELV